MRARVLLSSVILSAGSVAAVASPTGACSSDHPSFAEAVASATSIARVMVLDDWEPGEDDISSTHEVVETLKGSLTGTVHLENPRSTLCGDYLHGFSGHEAIVAYGVPFFGERLNLAWAMSKETAAVLWGLRPVGGSTPVPETVRDLDDLADVIRAMLPDTALTPPGLTWPGTLGGLLFTAGAVLLGRRLARR